MKSRTVLILRALRWLMEDRLGGPFGRTVERTPHGQQGQGILDEIELELEASEGEGDGALGSKG